MVPEGNQLAAHFVQELTGEAVVAHADQVVVEHGTVPVDELYQQMRGASRNDGVMDQRALVAGEPQPRDSGEGFVLYRIGDAVSSRNVQAAMFDALRLCSRL